MSSSKEKNVSNAESSWSGRYADTQTREETIEQEVARRLISNPQISPQRMEDQIRHEAFINNVVKYVFKAPDCYISRAMIFQLQRKYNNTVKEKNKTRNVDSESEEGELVDSFNEMQDRLQDQCRTIRRLIRYERAVGPMYSSIEGEVPPGVTTRATFAKQILDHCRDKHTSHHKRINSLILPGPSRFFGTPREWSEHHDDLVDGLFPTLHDLYFTIFAVLDDRSCHVIPNLPEGLFEWNVLENYYNFPEDDFEPEPLCEVVPSKVEAGGWSPKTATEPSDNSEEESSSDDGSDIEESTYRDTLFNFWKKLENLMILGGRIPKHAAAARAEMIYNNYIVHQIKNWCQAHPEMVDHAKTRICRLIVQSLRVGRGRYARDDQFMIIPLPSENTKSGAMDKFILYVDDDNTLPQAVGYEDVRAEEIHPTSTRTFEISRRPDVVVNGSLSYAIPDAEFDDVIQRILDEKEIDGDSVEVLKSILLLDKIMGEEKDVKVLPKDCTVWPSVLRRAAVFGFVVRLFVRVEDEVQDIVAPWVKKWEISRFPYLESFSEPDDTKLSTSLVPEQKQQQTSQITLVSQPVKEVTSLEEIARDLGLGQVSEEAVTQFLKDTLVHPGEIQYITVHEKTNLVTALAEDESKVESRKSAEDAKRVD